MRLSEKAQSIIEYTVVILLVAGGIILTRPYLVRSINAHMKSWDDSAQDSMKERLKQVEPPIFICDCSSNWRVTNPQGCCRSCGSCPDNLCCWDMKEHMVGDPGHCPADCVAPICDGDGDEDPGETMAACCTDVSFCGDSICCLSPPDGPVAKSTIAGNMAAYTGKNPIGRDSGCAFDCPQIYQGPCTDTGPGAICDYPGGGGPHQDETIMNCKSQCCAPLCAGNCGNPGCTGQCPTECSFDCAAQFDLFNPTGCCEHSECLAIWNRVNNPRAPEYHYDACINRDGSGYNYPVFINPCWHNGADGNNCYPDYAGDKNCIGFVEPCRWWVNNSCPVPPCTAGTTCQPP